MSEKDAGTATFRALDILTAIASEESPIGVPELCSRLGLPKPTVHRLCQKLESENYLAREPDGRRFAPGPKLLRLGFGVISSSISAERRMILEKLVERTGETCNFATRAGAEVLYLDRVEARWPLRMHLEPGSRVPMHCTASGKLFLSSLRAPQRQRILASLNLKRFTPNTLTDIPSLEREFNRILERGYSVDDQEFLEGLCALAVPVRDSSGRILAALACHGPMPRFTLEHAVSLLPYFYQASERLASTLPN